MSIEIFEVIMVYIERISKIVSVTIGKNLKINLAITIYLLQACIIGGL